MTAATPPTYTVRAADPLPGLGDGWKHPSWARAETAALEHFRPEGSPHKPRTQVRLLHNSSGIRGVFHIDDQYVSSIRVGYLTHVWKDSCVEFFMQPKADKGYFNLEMNAGGSHLCNYIEDPTRVPDGFKKFTPLPPEWGGKFQVKSSLPSKIDPQIADPVTWEMNFFVPFTVLEHYVGPLGNVKGQTWRGNFYKCGDETSHPHWGSWSMVDVFNFHTPRCFGVIRFE